MPSSEYEQEISLLMSKGAANITKIMLDLVLHMQLAGVTDFTITNINMHPNAVSRRGIAYRVVLCRIETYTPSSRIDAYRKAFKDASEKMTALYPAGISFGDLLEESPVSFTNEFYAVFTLTINPFYN